MKKKLLISKLQELTLLNTWVAELAMELHLKTETEHKIQIILDDFLANIFLYNTNNTSLSVRVKAILTDNDLVFKITDNGIAFNLLDVNTPNTTSNIEEREVGGLGLHLVKSLANKVEYAYEEKQNINIITILKI